MDYFKIRPSLTTLLLTINSKVSNQTSKVGYGYLQLKLFRCSRIKSARKWQFFEVAN
jgi:hypothetical protein